MNEHYAIVLSDLRNRKAELERELHELDTAMALIQRRAGEPAAIMPLSAMLPQEIRPESGVVPRQIRYSNMSVRWGAMWELADAGDEFQRTSAVANALLEGGYKTDATNFVNMVSAVLSNMKQKGEVETNGDGGYRLTEAGRQTWALIRQGHKFRTATSASAPSLLSVQ
jgi:hypothetical protein